MNKEWSELNKTMQAQIKKKDTYKRGIDTLLTLRSQLIQTLVSFKEELCREDFNSIPFINADGYHSKTIAYSIWHIFRIEDIVVHTVINEDEQVFFAGNYQERMGWNTSHQVVTELSPQEWVYNKFTTYVLTHKECNSSQQIHFTSENPVLLLERLKQEAGKDIWICGGANLVQQLVSKNMIDKYYISVIPTLLGNGVRLLGNIDREIKLRLCKTQTYNGITDLIYMRR